jgi:hypothetical protein
MVWCVWYQTYETSQTNETSVWYKQVVVSYQTAGVSYQTAGSRSRHVQTLKSHEAGETCETNKTHLMIRHRTQHSRRSIFRH